jgi:replication factor C large subunit
MLTEKYKPKKIQDIVGQQDAIKRILGWFDSWEPGDKALLIHGPVGVGKTTIIQVFAMQKNIDFIEMNASDYRSAKQIRESIGRSIDQQSLFKRGKVFMIDEIDTLSGKADRGGVGEVVKLIQDTKYPIVLTANKPWESKLSSLRKHCTLVELNKLSINDIERQLRDIAAEEKIPISRDALRELAKMSDGDLRAAITDLQSLNSGERITDKHLALLSSREREKTVYEALNKIFKADSVLDARRAIDNIDRRPDEMMWWIEANITREFDKPEELAAAFDALSAADVFRGRIRRTRRWRFLVYMIDLMTGGVAVARRKKYFKHVHYQYPTLIATLGRTKRMRAEQEAELRELAEQLHCSTRKVRTEFLPYFRLF